jgi:hypothetical protein
LVGALSISWGTTVTIKQWQNRFVRVMEKKFKSIPPQKRLKYFLGNVRDAKQAVLLKERIIKPSSIRMGRRKKLYDYKHRIAAVFPDLFVICGLYRMNLDYELTKVMKWYEKQKDLSV